MKKYTSLFFFLAFFIAVSAQDSVRVMHYNILQYGNGCSGITISDKNAWLETITSYYQPDIFTVNEMGGQAAYADSILSALTYAPMDKGDFSNTTSAFIVNMMFYNTDKFGYAGMEVLTGNLRDINVYRLYHKASATTVGSDTIFLNCIVAHFKASTGTANQATRLQAAQTVMNWLATQPTDESYMLMGDLNLYSAGEPAFQELIAHPNTSIRLIDVSGYQSSWGGFATPYAYTQSTRASSPDCGAGGALDDRFDFQLFHPSIINNSNGVEYVSGSYLAYGNDGLYNQALPCATHSYLPSNICDALVLMSDHLPVISELVFDVPTDTSSNPPISAQASGRIRITEIMYNDPLAGNDQLEFIELYNADEEAINLEGYSFQGVNYTFPSYVLQPAEYVVVAVNASTFATQFGFTPLEWSSGALNNGGELVALYDSAGAVVDSVRYNDTVSWPAADGDGPSLVLCDERGDHAAPTAWRASAQYQGLYGGLPVYASPGTGECLANCGKDNFEPNDNFGTAADLPRVGINMNAKLCDASDEDWYVFWPEKPHAQFRLSGLEADLALELYDASQTLVASVDVTGVQDEVLDANGLTTGQAYRLKVSSSNGSSSNVPYRLTKQERFTPFAALAARSQSSRKPTHFISPPSLFIQPNPATTHSSILLPENQGITLEIWSMDGRLMLRKQVQGPQEIDLSSFAKGLYWVRAKLGAEWREGKLVKTE